MRRRKTAALILTAAVLAAQAGIPAGEVRAAEAGAPAEVLPDLSASPETVLTLMWNSPYDDPQTQDPFYRWAAASFETWGDREGVTLELLPAQAPEKTSEAAPDLIVVDSSSLAKEVQAGVLTDLSAEAAEYGEWSWYYETVQDMACTANGLYGVPFEARAAGLWYDAEAFAAAGIIEYDQENEAYEAWEPESPEEITDACKKLRKADREALFADLEDPLLYELMLRSCGGRLATAEGNWIVESNEAGSALGMIAELAKQSQTAAGSTAEETDAQEREWAVRAGFTAPEEMGDAAGFAAMPAKTEDAAVSLVQGKLLAIASESEDRELTWSFLCHMMSKEQYSAYISEAAASGALSVRKDTEETAADAESRDNTLKQELLAGAGLYRQQTEYEAAEEHIIEMLEKVLENPSDAGIREAQEGFAESMRDTFGEERCRPRAETEEEE